MFALSYVLGLAVALNPEDVPTNEQVVETIQRSIRYIEERGTWWIEEKNCVSCHRVNNMIWSLSAAKRSGFDVSEKLDEWLNWAVESSLSENDDGKIVGLGNKEGVAQILLSLQPETETDAREKLAALLVEDQQTDGSWKAGGQLPSQKRAKSETDAVSTMWLALALINESQSEQSPVLDRAIKFIQQSPPGESTEWHAVRLLLAAKRNEAVAPFINELRQQQQPDGGWGWLVGEESDALGTGMAVYALVRAGVKRDDPAIQHAQQFLISTQRENGSWAVKGTKAKKKDQLQETAAYWGTTWAVLGLTASIPDGKLLN